MRIPHFSPNPTTLFWGCAEGATVAARRIVLTGIVDLEGAYRMPWSAKFATPISLNDGRQLMTLDDAAELVMGLPDARLHKPCWTRAIDVLIEASDDDAPSDAIAEAEAKLAIAFKLEGLI
jgi:hypothetical protein